VPVLQEVGYHVHVVAGLGLRWSPHAPRPRGSTHSNGFFGL